MFVCTCRTSTPGSVQWLTSLPAFDAAEFNKNFSLDDEEESKV